MSYTGQPDPNLWGDPSSTQSGIPYNDPYTTNADPTGTNVTNTPGPATGKGANSGFTPNTPAAATTAGQYGDYALDSLHFTNGHLYGEKRVISGDPNNPGQSKYDYQMVDLGDVSTPAGLAAASAATTIPVDMLTQQIAVLQNQNAQTTRGTVATNFEYAGNFNGQDVFSATNPDGSRTHYTAADLVSKGWAQQSDLDVTKQNFIYSQNRMTAANRLSNVQAMGNGMYSVTNPDGSRTSMSGAQVMATQSASQFDLDQLDREKTQRDLDYAHDQGLANHVSNISYAGNGQFSATNYYGQHGTYNNDQLVNGTPIANPYPGAQTPPAPLTAQAQTPAPAPTPPPNTAAAPTQAPTPTPNALPGSPAYAAPAGTPSPAPAPTSMSSSASLGVGSSGGSSGAQSPTSAPAPSALGALGSSSATAPSTQSAASTGATPTGAGSTGTGSATQAELDQARQQWMQQQHNADTLAKMTTSRNGVGMGFSGSQTGATFTGVR